MEKGQGDDMTRCWWHMYFICIDLTFVARLHMVITINFHFQLVITCSQDPSGHCIPTRMSPIGAFMDFCYNLVCFVSIHTSEKDRIIIPFIEHAPTQEEFGRELS